jgi:ferredoxin, 2Fe-2S
MPLAKAPSVSRPETTYVSRAIRHQVLNLAYSLVIGLKFTNDHEHTCVTSESESNYDTQLVCTWSLEPNSRLNCQAFVAQKDLVVEIPCYTINHAKENH